MNRNYFPTPEPAVDLFDRIVSRLDREMTIQARYRLILHSVLLVLSIAALIPSFLMAWQAMSGSGFWQFFSLIFSDLEIISHYWQSFLLTLLESLPMLSLIVFLAAILFFLESLKFFSKNLKLFLIFKHN